MNCASAEGARTKNVGASGTVPCTLLPSQKRTWNGRDGRRRRSSLLSGALARINATAGKIAQDVPRRPKRAVDGCNTSADDQRQPLFTLLEVHPRRRAEGDRQAERPALPSQPRPPVRQNGRGSGVASDNDGTPLGAAAHRA